jgi:hypothetical protein
MEFKPGDKVKVVQKGTIYVGGLTLSNNTFNGVEISRRNRDGSYQVKGIIRTPESDEITIPEAWIQPVS